MRKVGAPFDFLIADRYIVTVGFLRSILTFFTSCLFFDTAEVNQESIWSRVSAMT